LDRLLEEDASNYIAVTPGSETIMEVAINKETMVNASKKMGSQRTINNDLNNQIFV